MVLIFGFPENYRTFGGIGLPVKADASLSVLIRRGSFRFSGGVTPSAGTGCWTKPLRGRKKIKNSVYSLYLSNSGQL